MAAAKPKTAPKPKAEETPAPTVLRPADLAKELDVSPKVLRAQLRRAFPRTKEDKNTSWALSLEQADAMRKHFTKVEDTDTTSDDE